VSATFSTVVADYDNTAHVEAIGCLMRDYSADVMGGGEPLSHEHCKRIAGELKRYGGAVTVLAFDSSEKAVGLATSLRSFSTFMLKPLLNLHDVYVDEGWRRRGVGAALLKESERVARELGCCKLTLEVLSNNHSAQSLYRRVGFEPYELSGEAGQALFWQKKIV